MALKPIVEMINVLKGLALPAVPVGRIGETTPKLPADLPTVRVVVSELVFSPLGIGGVSSVYLDGSDNWVEERGRRITGSLILEAWGADEDVVNSICLASAEGVADSQTALLGKGFLRLRQSKWLPAEDARLRGTTSDTALKQALSYDMIFEDIEIVASGPAGPIKEIDVRIQPPFEEGMDLKKP